MDNYIERKSNGTLLPFDYSGGPPYVHPDSRMRAILKTKNTRKLVSATSSSGGTSNAPSEEDDDDDDDDDDANGSELSGSSESSSEGYEEDENGVWFWSNSLLLTNRSTLTKKLKAFDAAQERRSQKS
jgi:hypothetical protein